VRQIQAQKVRLEGLVQKRTQEIRAHSNQIEKQKEVIEEKNDQIMSSIRYAERIQAAILPIKIRVDKVLPDRFVIFMPKDIVSGDFYWVNEVDDKIVVAVVDCTGHGVPGAFMSMIGNTLLNQIVMENKILDPAAILVHLNVGVRQMLKQGKGESESHDGMDVCLCVIENTSVPLLEGGYKKKLVFAGARRPLYLMQGDGEISEFVEIRGTRHSIGGRQPSKDKKREFQNHVLDIQSGDMIYLTSDGFIDQQNVEEVRFGSKRLKNFLREISGLESAFQKERLLAELKYHQGEEDQMDDITIVGVRI
jgi:serine phosphatase RsbU (regulator of sigma subunit)